MNYFNRSLREFNNLQNNPTNRVGIANTGITGADLLGAGLQIGGGILQERGAKEDAARQKEMALLEMSLKNRQLTQQARNDVITQQQGDRSQNMQAFDMLSQMREGARSRGRLSSMRSDFLKAIG